MYSWPWSSCMISCLVESPKINLPTFLSINIVMESRFRQKVTPVLVFVPEGLALGLSNFTKEGMIH
jgi:hypothetical protein